jgi:hypothetical protein
MSSALRPLFAACFIVAVAACSKSGPATPAAAPAAKHEHHAPHGGTPVVLGAEIYHLELVLDPAAGKLSAFVLDGEMENFIRVKQPSFEVVATAGGASHTLAFRAVADSATGETVGDTALFEASADWLKSAKNFAGILTSLDVRGTVFTGVAFNFPKGNDQD